MGVRAMGQLEGKVAIITGAGTGIGKGIARAFAREGADLVIASRNPDVLENTASELRPPRCHRGRSAPLT